MSVSIMMLLMMSQSRLFRIGYNDTNNNNNIDEAVLMKFGITCGLHRRGLNPPHRVKSISMTTFSQQEVEFLQHHGNEVGKRTWMAVYDPKSEPVFDPRDAQRLKDFLQEKYEKKKWHMSKSRSRRGLEETWSPPAQTATLSSNAAPGPPPTGRPARTQSQPQQPTWERAPPVSPADLRTDVFTAPPARSQSFREPPRGQGSLFSGFDRQRPAHISPGAGQGPAFPALPRPSASSTFKTSFTLGRSVSSSSSSSGSAPFRPFPKSSSIDFGGLGSSQHAPTSPPPPSADKYAALSQLEGVSAETQPAPPNTFPQYGSLFGNKMASGATPARSPGFAEAASSPQTFPVFSNPFSSASSGSHSTLSSSNPFSSSQSIPAGRADPGQFSSASPGRVNPPPASFVPPSSQNAFPQQPPSNPQPNGVGSLPGPKTAPKPARPVSVNPFTGGVYPRGGVSRNPFM
ncbi:arf-GAP domain and FG repeat-containing protein 2 isoform X2 [Amia ocellicauda]|uniref:arf-GAP domain and FG repeat-containing protein 2 isoform X2 n=1 Tax=Amia ocellicauda TaxID=2972642 RepID=UPI003464799C